MQKLNLILNKQVEFDESSHTYFYQDTRLSGITSIISRLLFPNKYGYVPRQILDRAAAYGTMIHKKCEENDLFDTIDCVEVESYMQIKKENNLIPIRNEYLVSDNAYIATLIDNVFRSTDTSVHLGDIKTTSQLDVDYLSWQLSICAYLFELQNTHLIVDKLFGIWLRKDRHKLIEVERKSNEKVELLINIYKNINHLN